MNRRARKIMALPLLAAGIIAAAAGIAAAHEWGGPIDPPHVTCTAIRLDPPNGAWVHLVGDFGPFHVDEYGVRYGNEMYFPKTFNKLHELAVQGPVGYELAATWSLDGGKHYSKVSSGWIDCEDEHPTTTTTVKHETTTTLPGTTTTTSPKPGPTVTSVPRPSTSTTVQASHHLTVGTPASTICEKCLLPPPAQAGARGVLPHTGSSLTWPLLFVSSAMLAAGLLIIAKSRKPRVR